VFDEIPEFERDVKQLLKKYIMPIIL